ncbi:MULTISPECIES: MFS transporter [Rickettsieae]|uniref:MFS transporter n=1 Tax=Rickettsieae TaxID=33988 RepID=UPI000B9C5211|nr:MFS transporter [Rickettsia endosymbiont of Culicoides newsteadi]OZG32129.1 MFS transporter [Rickettsia endosymbiont of Culicoides newsteadi]
MSGLVQENTRIIPDRQTSLTREQKEAVGLLSIGTFLEYFDLMLYVHLAVLLNELFFPKYESFAASMLTAFAFCSTFIFRPIGALIFGYIGDRAGRKATVIITTIMMAISCVIMANVPTYAQIGITASIIITVCRVLQGMSSVGELVGAELYLTETIKPPIQYPTVAFVAVASVIGTTAALGVASLVTSYGLNWRLAFWIGAIIALVGGVSRTTLRETPDFVDAKLRLKKKCEKANIDIKELANNPIVNEKVNKKSVLYLFIVNCVWPVCFYFSYVHCGSLLKSSFGYSAEQVIHQNFILSMIQLAGKLFVSYLSYKIYPMKILKVQLVVFSIFVLFSPYILNNITEAFYLFLFQIFLVLFAIDIGPAVPIFFKYFPVFKRYTYNSMIYAVSRALMYVITSFGILFLTKYFGHWGLLIIMIPISVGFAFGLRHFQKLEKEAGIYVE